MIAVAHRELQCECIGFVFLSAPCYFTGSTCTVMGSTQPWFVTGGTLQVMVNENYLLPGKKRTRGFFVFVVLDQDYKMHPVAGFERSGKWFLTSRND